MPRLTTSRLAEYADLTIDALGSRANAARGGITLPGGHLMALAQPDHLTTYILDTGGRI